VLCFTIIGTAVSRTVDLRQAKQPSEGSSLGITELTVTEGRPFRIERHRAPWYPPPLFRWKTARLYSKQETDFVLSKRVQLDSDTGMVLCYRLLNILVCYIRLYNFCIINSGGARVSGAWGHRSFCRPSPLHFLPLSSPSLFSPPFSNLGFRSRPLKPS